MSKLILYPILAIICVTILAVIGYYFPNVAFVLICVIGVIFLIRFAIGIINLWKDWGRNTIMYVIKKGKHYSDYILPQCRIIKRNHIITKTFSITRSCLYHFGDVDDYDVNKLWGLTFGFNPKKNSIRFGWNCEDNDGTISIFSFRHFNNDMSFDKIAKIDTDKKYEFKMIISDGCCSMFINGSYLGKWLIMSNVSRFVVLNKPYFGGNKTAPQDMIIVQE